MLENSDNMNKVIIYDNLGREVHDFYNVNRVNLNLSHGVYYVKVFLDNLSFTKTFSTFP